MTTFGPFVFEKEYEPISPILYMHLQEDVKLKKSVEIVLPHIMDLSGLSKKEIDSLGIHFAKSSIFDSSDKTKAYRLRACDSSHQFVATKGKNFGILASSCFCYVCIVMNISKDDIRRKNFRVCKMVYATTVQHSEPPRHRYVVDFRVIRSLKACQLVSKFICILPYDSPLGYENHKIFLQNMCMHALLEM